MQEYKKILERQFPGAAGAGADPAMILGKLDKSLGLGEDMSLSEIKRKQEVISKIERSWTALNNTNNKGQRTEEDVKAALAFKSNGPTTEDSAVVPVALPYTTRAQFVKQGMAGHGQSVPDAGFFREHDVTMGDPAAAAGASSAAPMAYDTYLEQTITAMTGYNPAAYAAAG